MPVRHAPVHELREADDAVPVHVFPEEAPQIDLADLPQGTVTAKCPEELPQQADVVAECRQGLAFVRLLADLAAPAVIVRGLEDLEVAIERKASGV